MKARLYKPAKSAMSSGMGQTKHWVLEFSSHRAKSLDPLMGWTSSSDTQNQIRLTFDNQQAALNYANAHNISVVVQTPHKRSANVRANGYGENFATNRRQTWTH